MMEANSNPVTASSRAEPHWAASLNCRELIKTFNVAAFPSRWLWSTLAIVLLLAWGNVLDFMWLQMERGVSRDALTLYVAERPVSPPDQLGIFSLWLDHEMTQVNRMTWDALRLKFISGVLPAIQEMLRGVLWIGVQHPIFALLLFGGFIVIFSLTGGVVCREAALDFARGEKIPPRAGPDFVRSRAAQFILAIGFPVLLIVGLVLVLSLLGWLMAIPWVGNVLLMIVLFPLALMLGALVALMGFGLPTFGHLLIPGIAIEGTDAFDAFGRAFNYILVRPLLSLFYAIFLVLYGALSWIVIRTVAFLMIWSAHAGLTLMAGDYTLFRGGFADLNGYFPAPSLHAIYPVGFELTSAAESAGAFLAKMFVGLVLCAVWGFALSFYFSACTVAYFLLRKSCDWTDLEDVYQDEDPSPHSSISPLPAPTPVPSAPTAGGGVSLPVVGSP